MQPSRLENLAKNKYNRLLFVQILFFLGFPFIQANPIVNFVFTVLFFLIFLGTLILTIAELEESRKIFRWYLILAFLSFIFEVVGSLDLIIKSENILSFIISNLIFLFFLAVSIWLIIREIFPSHNVNGDTIKGGVCIYLLLGLFWYNIYEIIYILNSNSFKGIVSSNSQADLLYFSYTTLTTVGYGDITPVVNFARIFANLESVVGIMYPAIYISRLVGIYSNEQAQEKNK
ncbi:ion channel [Aerosakkonemataceae cyanobacterium BLCC-F154]|uniref:Ion channel n=1 Tax=Floridaenema fluviatile BLCC-F154 TaxID=3153640 RepID=A0ABV4Y4N6_9CYAN